MNEIATLEKLRGRKVLIVLGWFRMGGAERQAVLLARELLKRGVRVEIWGFFEGRVRAQCRQWNIPTRVLLWPLSRFRGRSLARLSGFGWQLRRAQADFILPYTTVASTIVGASWKLSGARAAFWNQRDEGRDIHGAGTPLQRLALRNVSLTLANSQHAAEMMRERFGLSDAQVLVVQNGIEVAPAIENRAQIRARWKVDENALAIVMIANLHGNKDHATLLEAWRIVLGKWRANSDATSPILLLAGSESDTAAALRAQAERLQLSENMRFLGDVRDIGGLLGACDIAVHSSRKEGVPNALLEAMACGLPVVGTDIFGIREALGIGSENHALSANQAAQLAPIGDAEVLAERLLRLLQSAALRTQLGQANRAHIAAHWSPEIMCDQFCEIFARFV